MENTTSRSTSRSHTVDSAANAKLHDDNSTNMHSVRQPDTLNLVSYSCPEAKVLNSRRKKHLGFAVHSVQASSEPTPQFIQPSKVYYRARYPGTPPYPTRGARQKQIQLQPSKSEISKNTSRRDKLKPYVLEPPVQAQRFPKNKCCDVFPWKGNHPEDHVTDAQARNGQYDKLFVGKHNNEQGSARSPLIATFKQRNGLRSLSSLYLTILEKRQSYSAVTATSTFKPPPRVTLPDQKREAWLRDLANPLVPLRRLSRTIPHGLKGPALLEQCVAKSVPTARAVWFVRCVGANELRGLRRKGVGSLAVGGEAKWINEWTSHVMQFLEKSIGACGTMTDDLWRTKMHYSIRLATHLYAENLLDRMVFLEWYLSFLESSALDVLPLVIVLAPAFWEDLLKLRRFSRRLAEVLLAKYEAVITNNVDQLLMPLIRRLSIMASNLLLCHRESLVGVGDGARLQQFMVLVDSRFSSTQLCLRNVSLRSNYFDGLKGTSNSASVVSDRRKAVEYLDGIELPFNAHDIHQQLSFLLSAADLVPCVFEWAVTSLRTGQYRIYLGAELLRLASVDGFNIQTSVMEFLGRLDVHTKVNKDDVYLLISELVRTEYFSIAVYLRWLIAKGGLAKISYLDEGCPCYVRLLAEIPIHSASAPLRNLRSILLNGCSFDCNAEERSVIESREMLSMRGMFNMPTNVQADRYTGLDRHEMEKIRNLTRTAKSELAQWIKESFEDLVTREQTGQYSWRSASVDSRVNTLPAMQIILIRDVLEQLSDIAVLLDIIKLVLVSDDWDVLTLVADTINYNLEAFWVLHPLNDFVQSLYLKPVSKEFIASFLDLLTATGSEGPIRQEMISDLAVYNQRNPRATAAHPTVTHSPISEPMDDDIFDDADMENNEIDILWNSTVEVDKQNLSRIFETTVSKMETSFEDTDNQSHILTAARGLTKLRQFDADVFDELSQRWVLGMQSYSNRIPLFRAFSSLIAGSCLKLDVLASVALKVLSQHREGLTSAFDGGMFIAMVLQLIIQDDPFRTSLSAKDFYTLKLKRKLFVSASAVGLLGLFRDVFELCTISQDDELNGHVLRLMSSDSTLGILRGLAIQKLDLLKAQVIEPLVQTKKPGCLSWLQQLVDNLLDDNDSNDNSEVDAHVQVARLLDLADDFSISLCKLKMQIILNVDPRAETFGSNDTSLNAGSTIARSFVRGFASASQERRKICTDLITVLSKDCANKIRADVEELFLEWNNFLQTRQLIKQLDLHLVDDHETGESLARAFLSVVEATSSSTQTTVLQFIPSLLVERMVKFIQMISTPDEEAGGVPDLSWRNRDAFSEFRCWFVLFMRLVILHRAGFTQVKSSMIDQARMLAGLCCLLQREIIRNDEAHFELVLGIASSFCDGLPDDTRFQLKRYAKGKRSPPMCSYLVGSGDGAESLKAIQKGKTVEFSIKPWERLAEPTPGIGENDVSLSLALFRTRRF
ncbi:hypothetical protein K440DRAFT_663352 [Wilcoxina mikolae CBS 423.85]|nr:hypothetical protein K440DRAFT_663352 [Wilcoxina mikolae CBS 423.85]